jgi:hypothetical protein
MEWLVKIGESDYKVESIETLKQWVRERRIRPEHYVFHPVLQKWMYAKDLEELRGIPFPAIAPAVAETQKAKKTSGCIVLLVLLAGVLLTVCVVLVVGLISKRGTSSYQGEQTGSRALASTIDYKTAAEWSIPNGGYSRVIVIARQNLNDPDMRRLGEQLRYETRSQRNAFVFIYDDARAASLRQAALDESLSKADLSFHDQHLVGAYMRNANTGFHQLAFGLQGINGPQVTVDY